MTGRAPRRGHAIEIRLNAEDPDARLHAGAGHDHAVPAAARARACASTRSSRTAPSIPPYYDSMIAKLDRVGHRPRRRDRAGRAGARRAGRRRRPDDARARARDPRAARSSEAASTRPRRSRSSGWWRHESASSTNDARDGRRCPDDVLVGIAVRAAESVEGIRVGGAARCDVERRQVRLSVAARRGEPLRRARRARAGCGCRAAEGRCVGSRPKVDVAVGELT